MTSVSSDSVLRAIRIRLGGCVQGQGVRPAIHRLAVASKLNGRVTNTLHGVEIEVEGSSAAIDEFLSQLPRRLPASAVVDSVSESEIDRCGYRDFAIVQEKQAGALATRIPADIATCDACLAEVADPNDRRYGYPLTSCVRCGPRYTIIRSMPYERQHTAMDAFPFCSACQGEYNSAEDRRFHAEASTCPECGPRVWLVGADGTRVEDTEDVIGRSVDYLRRGKIVALRGLGGYQLLVDATDEAAVKRLRDRKGRHGKPLAVMAESLERASRLAWMDDVESEQLQAPANPIVLVKARSGSPLAPSIHPGLDLVGLMLPTTALHRMILQAIGRPVVCTSGNREGEPLEIAPNKAEQRLSDVADAWLHHDRPILRPVDDSVVRVIAGRPTTIRLARGMAPWPLELSLPQPTLAVGGFLKSAIAWSDGSQSVLGSHIGDHRTLATRHRFEWQIQDAERLYNSRATHVVHDDHPNYYSTEWARASALECVAAQHHHAHVVAGMLEQRWLDRTVMGVAWDGTGYGSDGTIWGGEFLVARADSFRRVGHLRPFRLPGGEIAIHQPWRTALAVLSDALGGFPLLDGFAPEVDAKLKSSVQRIATHREFSPVTTSAGRLFDAAAVIILGLEESQFDGQPAMMLEAMADTTAEGSYEFPLQRGDPFQLDWRPLFAELFADKRRGTDAPAMAMRFHRSMAEGIMRACQQRKDLPAVLAGGVFQNRLLVELLWQLFDADVDRVGLPGRIPSNDGGLAAGQLAIAAARQSGWSA